MGEKFYDIIPPAKFEEITSSEEIFEEEKKRRRIGKKTVVFVFFVVLALASFFYLSTTSKAEVEIWPKLESFNSEIKIQVKEEALEVSFIDNIIPGYILEEESPLSSQQFSATGKVSKSEKARGVIRVYNNYSSHSQPLREGTRFMSASGKVFKAPERIIIPGQKIENGKEIPGFVDVEVVAAEAGEEYNIEPTIFSIPGLAGTALYTKFRGESSESMRGGFDGESLQVTEKDLERAEEGLIKKLKEEGMKNLKLRADEGDLILLEDALRQEVKESFSLIKAGAIMDKFNYSAKIKSTALAFRKGDAERLIEDFIKSKNLDSNNIYKESLNIEWKPREIDLEEEGERGLSVKSKFSVKTYSDISELDIKREIEGKNITEAESVLEEKRGISQAEVKIRPFWINRVPGDINKIDIKIKLD